jgi:signal transduction histidine kinase
MKMIVKDKYAKQLHNLASDLLAVSRIETGKIAYLFERTNIGEFVIETVDDILKSSPDFTRKQNELFLNTNVAHVAHDVGNGYVSMDKERITQVLTNIINNINNAIKFTEKGISQLAFLRGRTKVALIG